MLSHLHGSSTYKRLTSRDDMDSFDIEENSALLQNGLEQETSTPSWKLSFPHVLVATLVSFLFGYHLGVVNEPLESIASDLGFNGNTLEEGLVVSTCLAGAFLGSLTSGWIADGVGRRRAFQLCALPMLVGATLCATTRTLAGMLLGRFLVGTGLGVGPPVASLYVTEVSPAHVRGTYGSFIQIATCLGLMASLLIGIPVKSIVGWWRYCFWISTVPAAILALAMAFCAESPHWLYKRGQIAEAESEFERLLGGSHVKVAIAELAKLDRGDETDTVKLAELIFGRHSRVVFIGSTLYALQQLSGINAVFYFSSTVFRRAGVSSNLANVFVGIANLIGSIIALILMDKLGRRILLLWSFFGMAAAMALQVFAASLPVSNSGTFYLSISGMLMFVLTFAIGAGPVPGLLLPEIFSNRIRAKAMAFCMSVHWVLNFFVGLMFLRLLEQIGPQILYSIFGTFCLVAVVFVKRNVMETKGKSLQEIEIALLPQWYSFVTMKFTSETDLHWHNTFEFPPVLFICLRFHNKIEFPPLMQMNTRIRVTACSRYQICRRVATLSKSHLQGILCKNFASLDFWWWSEISWFIATGRIIGLILPVDGCLFGLGILAWSGLDFFFWCKLVLCFNA